MKDSRITHIGLRCCTALVFTDCIFINMLINDSPLTCYGLPVLSSFRVVQILVMVQKLKRSLDKLGEGWCLHLLHWDSFKNG
jgi:hypothetical protein